MACFFILTLIVGCLIALLPQFIWPEYYLRIIGMLAGIGGGLLLFRRLYGAVLREGLQEVIRQWEQDCL